MMCNRPGAITSQDLMAFIEGEAPAFVVEHIHSCPGCAAEARAYARIERATRPVLDRFDCPSPQELGEFELGLIINDDRWLIAGHVADCRRCADELRTLRNFLVGEVAPVPSISEEARRLVAAILAPARGLAHGSLRGAATPATLTFRAEDVTMTLSPGANARPGRVSVDGLLVLDAGESEYFAGREVRLVPSAQPAIVAVVDEIGNFSIEDLAPGGYRLELDLPDRVIVVDVLSLAS